MKKLFVLFAVVAMSFAQIGCGGTATDEAAAPAETPAATTGEEAGGEEVEAEAVEVEEPATTPEDAEAEN
ncbi:hypothetical protein Pan258_19710 [Symmachiella dynata]|uniref:hypothetical protein n=1 Tax=Symmachiella dynata TaxID=2527995 RepID=UPI00118AC739|nr:hypothetical protein [Symmachiella dynata]QDT47931.1 hypothetical protein Pan258_19710 [Symmachiella dynata]